MGLMQRLELTRPTPEENLALDEALLEEAETAAKPIETLRLWEPADPFVVLGRSSGIDRQVDRKTCLDLGVPVLRRISGGETIVAGPGCLMYALVLSYERRPKLRALDQAHRFVLGSLQTTLGPLVSEVTCRGTSDLALDRLKISGNSARCRRRHLLYHGTLLYDFPLDLIGRCLKMPPRQPDYRAGRDHGAFLTNLPLPAATIRGAVIEAFEADEVRPDWPKELTARLVAEKYGQPQWNEKL